MNNSARAATLGRWESSTTTPSDFDIDHVVAEA
jgi:hypothetical protein